jgi:hypothetical protein
MIGACLIAPGSFRATCQDALGLRAGGAIVVLGGRCAERKASMATTSTQAPWVDVGALAAAIKNDVTDRLATILTAGFESLEEDGRGLDQIQRAHLTQWSLDVFDGLERSIARTVIDDLRLRGISVWGLSSELADLLPEGADDA